jgi:hypothetical protein
MDESTSLIFRFLMSGVAGCGATVKPQIAAQQSLVQKGAISWSEYANRVATLVTDKSLYAQLFSFYKFQAVGWGLTILASALYS